MTQQLPSDTEQRNPPLIAAQAVMQPSIDLSDEKEYGKLPTVEGYDFNSGVDYSRMLSDSYPRMGFQATSLGDAIKLVNEMVIDLAFQYP
jgi:deoxyhypusine synthase